MELKIKFDAQDWSERTPTKSQLTNMLGDLSTFLNNLGGALLATGEFHIAEQEGPPQANPVASLLNMAGAAKQAQALFGGNSTSGIAIPQPGGPRAVPGR